MSVRPDDLANVCALYSQLGKKSISATQLRAAVARTLPLDASSSPTQIIEESLKLGIIYIRGENYYIAKLGKNIGNKQAAVATTISEDAKALFVNELYLNANATSVNCAALLSKFQPDLEEHTFAYDRPLDESPESLQLLMTLSRLGVLRNSGSRVFVESRYLSQVNEVLAVVRGYYEQAYEDDWRERRDVGKIAEELAISYEERRFRSKNAGYLSSMIRHISLVDQTAGYDIGSCRCGSRIPEEPIYIEVKGTRDREVKFIWTSNERRVAALKQSSYWIYCFTEVNLRRKSAKGPHVIKNPILRLCEPRYSVEPIDVRVRLNNV